MSLFRGHRVVQEQLFARLDSLLVIPFAVADLASVVKEVSACAMLWCVPCVCKVHSMCGYVMYSLCGYVVCSLGGYVEYYKLCGLGCILNIYYV